MFPENQSTRKNLRVLGIACLAIVAAACGGYANPVTYPLPSLIEVSTGAAGDREWRFTQRACVALSAGHSVAISLLPPVGMPASFVNGTVALRGYAHRERFSGFTAEVDAGARVVVNPILFDGGVYEFDILVGLLAALRVGYRIPMGTSRAVEPFLGIAAPSYTCLTPWTGFRFCPALQCGVTIVCRFGPG